MNEVPYAVQLIGCEAPGCTGPVAYIKRFESGKQTFYCQKHIITDTQRVTFSGLVKQYIDECITAVELVNKMYNILYGGSRASDGEIYGCDTTDGCRAYVGRYIVNENDWTNCTTCGCIAQLHNRHSDQ